MKTFWDSRYDTDQFVYGKEPNSFFAAELSKLSPGKILLPGEGEGRNAVYAASLGWEVHAFDQSQTGMEKALGFAAEMGVHINYMVCDLEEYPFKSSAFDVVGLTFFHAIPMQRLLLHQRVQETLKKGGMLILEAFHTSQIGNHTGGPSVEEMLFDRTLLTKDFSLMDILYLEEESVELNEGPFHQGEANVIRLLGRK